jgi:hypothetical protein
MVFSFRGACRKGCAARAAVSASAPAKAAIRVDRADAGG